MTVSLTSILQTTNDETLSSQAIKDKKNETISAGAGGSNISSRVDENIENLSTVINLAKKSKLTQPKKARLSNTKANSGTDFLTFGAIKAFIH